MPKKKTTTGKKHKGFYIYSRDLLSSQRYRRCSWAAKGVYLDLLNVLAVQDHPGALCLRDFDLKPQGERSLTQRCLACQKKAKNGEYQSIKYFAEAIAISASGPRPGLIHGLQELYLRGIICIVGDTLLQPRMYRDSKIRVTDVEGEPIDIGEDDYVTVLDSPDDGDADPDAERLRLGNMYKEEGGETPPDNTHKKDPKNPRVGAGDAHAQSKRVGVRDNNIKDNNSKGNTGGAGDAKPEKENAENTPQGTAAAPRRQAKGKAATAQRPVSEQPPTQEEVSAYWQERAEQGKPLLYISAEEFYATCETDGWTHGKDRKPIMNWKTFALGCDTYRRNHGDRPVGARPSAAAPPPRSGEPVKAEPNKDGQGKYRKW